MQQGGAITSIDSLEQFFTDCGEKYVYWTAYRGTDAKIILLRNEATDNKASSWELLKRTLVSNSVYGGTFTLHITNASKGAGGYQPTVVLPPQNGQLQQAGQGGSAINGLPLGVGSLNEYASNLKEKWEMEARIKELEKKSDAMNPYVGAFMAHPTFKAGDVMNLGHRIVGILERVSGLQMPNGATSIGIAGMDSDYETKTEAATDEATNNTHEPQTQQGDGEVITYDGEVLGDVCDELHKIDPSVEPEKFLLAMTDYLKANPTMLNMIKGQVQPFYEARKTAT